MDVNIEPGGGVDVFVQYLLQAEGYEIESIGARKWFPSEIVKYSSGI